MSTVVKGFVCRCCSAAAIHRLHSRVVLRATVARSPTPGNHRVLYNTQASSALALPHQHRLQRLLSTASASQAAVQAPAPHLGGMPGDVAMPEAEPQQSLQTLDTNAPGLASAAGASPALTRAGSKKRNRGEADAHPYPINASAHGQASLIAPEQAGQQPTSNSIEDTVRAAAELAQSDPGLLAGINAQDAAALPKPAEPLPNGKKTRGNRAKPAQRQQAVPSHQSLAEQPSEASLTDEQRSKRAKVAQAIAAVKVMVEQEQSRQNPAVANAPLTEDHPTHRVSHADAPPVVTAKPADAAPRITENFHDVTAGVANPQAAASTTKAAGKRAAKQPTAQSVQAESSDEAVLQNPAPEPDARAKPAPNRRQPASRKAGALAAAAVKADAPAEPLFSPSREAGVPAQDAPLPKTTAASRPRKRAGKQAEDAEVKQEHSASDSLQDAAAAQAAAVKKPTARSSKKVAAAAVEDLPSIKESSAEAAEGESAAIVQKAAPKPRRRAPAKKAAAPPVKKETATSAQDRAAAPVEQEEASTAEVAAIAPVLNEEPSTSEASAAGPLSAAAAAGKKKPVARSRKKVTAAAVEDVPSLSETSAQPAEGAEAPVKKKPARSRKKAAPAVKAKPAGSETSLDAETSAKKTPAKAKKKATSAAKDEPSMSDTSVEGVEVVGQASVKYVKKPYKRRKFDNELTIRLMAAARAALAAPETVVIPPRPVPNLGYACLNTTLQLQKPPVTSNRGLVLKTVEDPAMGLPYISELALQNCRDLLPIIQWNHEHNIRLFRLSSDLFPWGDSGKYELEELPDLPEIKEALFEVGQLARLYKQRLTAHPSEFVKMAAPRQEVLEKSILSLEVHSKVFDYMGYEPNLWNKTNIHIGGTYDDKQATLERFAENFHRLSPNAQKRLAVENDDKESQYSITDLMWLHKKIGVPLTFDFHHHRFCPGGLTHEEAFKAAIATWPTGIRPQVHWSEEPEDPEKVRRAHSKYIRGPMNLYEHAADVDVMIEAKSKEATLLDFRQYAEHDVQLPGAADEHDQKIYDRIVKEKEDIMIEIEKAKQRKAEKDKKAAEAAPFLKN